MQHPAFLDAFDLEALHADRSTLVALDPAGAIVWTNIAWSRFAHANEGADVTARFGLGTSYFAGIAGDLRDYYEEAFARCLTDGEPFELDYECSSAIMYRLHHLRVLPIAKSGLLLEHSLVIESPHDRIVALPEEEAYRDADGIIHQCSNCRRTRSTTGAWNWVPSWVERSPARTSHGICKVCIGYYWGARGKRRT